MQVASFLAALQPCWNFTLAFVMGGALLIATPIFQRIILRRKTSICGAPMACPTSTIIDHKLILGGIMFGAGWGIGGFCPGPALVALGNPQPKVAMLCTAMFVGMWCVTVLPKFLGGFQMPFKSGGEGAGASMRGSGIEGRAQDYRTVIGKNQKEK
jgi:uncharacterized membrane protein YedE/YeeE